MMKQTLLYICGLVLLFVIELVYFRVARRFGIVDRPSRRGSSDAVVLRGGGIIFPLASLVMFFADGMADPLFIAGLTLIAAVSFIDDVRSLSPKLRLPVQFIAMMLMLAQLIITYGAPRLPGTAIVAIIAVGLIVCTGATNIFNFMDGINGITGGYALVVLAAILYVFHHCPVGDYCLGSAALPTGINDMAVVTILADVVFCFFNFRTHARCFAGDVGSVSVAFIIVFLLGFIMMTTLDFSWLAFLVVYGVDGCLTILHRIMLHENITKPHRKHAFQLMANELHIPHVVVSLFYMVLQSICCLIYILCPGYMTLLIEIVVLSIAYILFMRKFYHLHAESCKS